MGSSAGNILKTVLPLAISFIAPELAPVLGITSSLGTAALGAGLGAGVGAATNHGFRGAIPGAISGGLGTFASDGGLSNLLSGGGFSGNATSPLSGIFGGSGLSGGTNLSGVVDNSPTLAANGATDLGSAPSLGSNALSNGTLTLGGGGASTFGGATGGSSFGGSGLSNLLGGNNLSNVISGGLNLNSENTAEDQLVKSQQQSLKALQPFVNNGTDASNALATGLGTNGNSSASGFGALTAPFTPSDLQNDPGYQFNLGQGTNALNNANAAAGSLDSGAALKAAQQFGQGLADTTYNNAFNRNLQQNSQTINALSGAAAPGLSAANSTADVNNNIGTAQSKGTAAQSNTLASTLSSLLSGSGARSIVGYKSDGTPIYA